MKKLFTLCFILLFANTKAQCPWNFTVTSLRGNFSITCSTTTLNLNTVNNNSNTVNYDWTGPSFSSTLASVSLTQAGSYTVIATDAVTSCSLIQTFVVGTNTILPNISASTSTQILTCFNPTILATG